MCKFGSYSQWFPEISFLLFLIMGASFSFVQLPRTWPESSDVMESGLDTASYPLESRMHLGSGAKGCSCCQEQQVCACLCESQTWLPLVIGALFHPQSWFSQTWACWEDGLLLKSEGKKICWALLCAPCWLSPAFLSYLQGSKGGTFSFIPIFWQVNFVKALIILQISCQILFQLCFTFPNSIYLHPGSVPIFCQVWTSLIPLPEYFLLTLWPKSPSWAMLVSSSVALIFTCWNWEFLHLRKMPLKSCWFGLPPFTPRAVDSQGISSTSYLKVNKFVLLKFRILTLLYTWPISLIIVCYTRPRPL